jgi:hypothetical protein
MLDTVKMHNIMVKMGTGLPYDTSPDIQEEAFRSIVIDPIHKKLKEGLVGLVFTKTNGEERKMIATLAPNYLPPYAETKKGSKRKRSPDAMAVFDFEEQEWRSFRLDSLLSAWEMIPIMLDGKFVEK